MAQGVRTDPEIEEAVYAYYVLKQNYSKTGRHFGLPISTVCGIVDRLKTDDIAMVRNAMRADIAAKCWRKASRMVDKMDPKYLGTEHTSATADAGQALDRLTRAAALMEPSGKDDVAQPAVINVYTAMPEPPELREAVIVDENTTSTGRLS